MDKQFEKHVPRKGLVAGYRPQGEVGRRTPNELEIEKMVQYGYSRRIVEGHCQTILFEGTARQILNPGLRFTEDELAQANRNYNVNYRGRF